MNKLLIIVCMGLLLVGSGVLFFNISKDEVEYDTGIDTGLTPEQTWQIINGEDIGEVLNLREVKE